MTLQQEISLIWERKWDLEELYIERAAYSAQEIAELKKAWSDEDVQVWQRKDDSTSHGNQIAVPKQWSDMQIYFYRD